MTSDQPSPTAERVYALDALRAVMMLLGIVLHAALTYTTRDLGTIWRLKDPDTSVVFNLVAAFVHAFRMPVFFVAAGYFAALLVRKKGPDGMLRNRVQRIALPFAVGVLTLYPLVALAYAFSLAAFAGAPDPFARVLAVVTSGAFLPFKVAHLWFLYFLAMFAVVYWALARAVRGESAVARAADRAFVQVMERPWLRLLCLSVAMFGGLAWMGTPSILTNSSWRITPSIFVTYFVFFGMGAMIYRTDVLARLTGHAAAQLTAASLLLLVNLFVPWPSAPWVLPVRVLVAALYSALFIFGFIALFLAHFNHYSRRLSYLMDAAYWVYLVHLPIVAFIPGLLGGLAVPAFVKFAITLLATTAICLASYHYLVRGSVVGMFLNGKVHRPERAHGARELAVSSYRP